MIALLNGSIAYKSIDHVIVDVGGVGYRLLIPLSTFYSLPDDGEVKLHVHTHVREDAIQLFGFLSSAEKQMFGTLIAVSGIGPKLAINILSHIPAAELGQAIAGEDVKRLSSLPGIGKKTAERLVLELKDKVPPTGGDAGGTPVAPPAAEAMDDLISALVNLGYKETIAKKALENLEMAPGSSFEERLKGALQILGQ